MKILLRSLSSFLVKIKRQAKNDDNHIVIAQLNKIEKEVKKLKSLIASSENK
tara:strand:+ start:539 stop:694 length:156 start_codon:yes stop_codon:yes gene_type:complete